jgi:hypothetical protein
MQDISQEVTAQTLCTVLCDFFDLVISLRSSEE